MSDPAFRKDLEATRIAVNGVVYDSVDAMPPDVRRTYDETLAKFPDLGDRDRGGIPQIFRGEVGPLQYVTTLQKKIVMDGKTYDSEASMPPDVRQIYEQAMRRAMASEPIVKKNEIKMSFQLTGPGFNFRRTPDGPARQAESQPALQQVSGIQMPAPIEPAPTGGRLLVALLVAVCIAAGLTIWLMARAR